MTTHDFRPGDVVSWSTGNNDVESKVIAQTHGGARCLISVGLHEYSAACGSLTLVSRPKPAITLQRPGEWSAGDPDTPIEHPSRSRAASSLRAASASLTTAIDHLTRAGEAETYPGQTVIRIRTAAEETQACIHHATMALYWLLHERLGS